MLINTNLSAQNSALLLSQSSQRLQQSLARLSSGSKINSPADDAAGLAVSMNFNAQMGRADAAGNNVANALSFSQTQDGYLQQVSNALNRMSELAVQAQDVTKSGSDRGLYNQEFQTLATYINNVATKDFNGVSLFSGNNLNVTSDSEGGTLQMKGVAANYLPATTTTTSTTTSTVGYAANTTLGQINSVFASNPSEGDIATGHQPYPSSDYSTLITPTSTISDLVNYLNSTGGETSAAYNSSNGQLSVTISAGAWLTSDGPAMGSLFVDLGLGTANGSRGGELVDNVGGSSPIVLSTTLTHSVTTTSTTTSSTGSLDISTAQNAAAALVKVKTAISDLASDRAKVGSNMERLNATSQELSTLKNNLSAANSRITDVDVAGESTNYAKQNILVQTGTAMLAQANAMPQSVLKLLG
jgi:flagellin